MNPCELGAAHAARKIREQRMTSEMLVHSCLAQIDAREVQVQAWAHLNYRHALELARRADTLQRSGAQLGPLHGVPVGIKDIFDTVDFPTEFGSPIFRDRQPGSDAAVVERLRAAGAIILGKTVTTEFASFCPNKTRNPHDLSRTPGGSSSGSAAAVASDMVPLALGSQTGGSTIRPGSFCGVVAFKPTFGAISRHGCMMLAESLDHVGLYARCVEDIALLAQTLYGKDDRDPTSGTVGVNGFDLVVNDDAAPPRFAFVPTPFWQRAQEGLRAVFTEYTAGFGSLPRVELPLEFSQAPDWLGILLAKEMAHGFDATYRASAEQMSPTSRADIETGQRVSDDDYADAHAGQTRLRTLLDDMFEHYDVLITPATLGEAPPIETTGDPIFCSIWTLCGFPSISMPLLTGPAGLPIGVQLIGPRQSDANLLRAATRLEADQDD